jgi:hypothetical protein
MAGKPTRFFGPATIVGDQTFYTPFMDISDYETMAVRLRVYGAIGGSPSLTITMQHASNPTGEDAEDLGAFTAATGTTSEDKVFTTSSDKMLNYVRAKIVVASAGGSDVGFFFELTGVAKSGE